MMQLLKGFSFTAPEYSELDFSDLDQIGLDFTNQWATLRKQDNSKYDIEADLSVARWIRSRVTTPKKSRKLRKLGSDITLPAGTIDGYLLGNGANAWRWNGANWVSADPDNKTDWNTEAEINEGIEQFVQVRSFCVFVRLGTNVDNAAPILRGVVVQYDADILSWDESFIKRTLIDKMEQEITPETDIEHDMETTGTTLSFANVVAEVQESLTFIEPTAAFDMDNDPLMEIDIFSSYNSGTKIITLTTSIAAGTRLLIRAKIRIPVTLESAHVDYIEVEKVPNIVITDGTENRSHVYPSRPYLVDKANDRIRQVEYSRYQDMDYNLRLMASRKFDLYRLQEKVTYFIETNGLIKNEDVDEDMSLVAINKWQNRTVPGIKGIFTSMSTLRIMYNQQSGTVIERYLVKSVNLTTGLA